MNSYVQRKIDQINIQYATQPEFLQAATEILESLSGVFDRNPQYEKAGILDMLLEPERSIVFRVAWLDDAGNVQVNTGYRVQFNSAIGPYKGGLRFHPSVTHSIMKFLGFEQIFKNSLTGLPIGGGKGGSNFDPKGKSDNEVMRFCQAFMSELYRHIGPDIDIPAGDIGVGGREIGYMYGYYKKLTKEHVAVLTGRGISYGGSLARKEATGFGLIYLVEEMLRTNGKMLSGKTCVVSGSGNVAIYAVAKANVMGAKCVAMSDSNGYIYDKNGIDLDTVKDIKEVKRGRIKEYLTVHPDAEYHEGCRGIWSIPCDVALPCATQNEIDLDSAMILVENGCIAVGEGANMPTTTDAIKYFQGHGVLFAPAKAANAGGVATSALEMAQSSQRMFWTFEQVDEKLQSIMVNIFRNISTAAAEYGEPKNYLMGANIAGFLKVADAMLAYGVC